MVNCRAELAPWVTALPTRSRAAIRRTVVGSFVGGGLLLAISVTAFGFAIATAQIAAELVGAVLFLGIGVLLVLHGRRYRAGLQRWQGDVISFAAPYAFDVTSSTIEFPPTFTAVAESWPLGESHASQQSGGSLVLSHGKRRRTYPAKALSTPVSELIEEIHSRQLAP